MTTLTVTESFNYAWLDAASAEFARETAEKVRGWQRRTVAEVLEIGRDLLEVKEALGYGRFTEWADAEFHDGIRTLQRCMQVATAFADKNDTVSLLPLSAVYLLAAPSTPKVLVDEVFAKAHAGEQIHTSSLRRAIKVIRKEQRHKEQRRTSLQANKRRKADDERRRSVEQQEKEHAEAAAHELVKEFGLATIKRIALTLDNPRVRIALIDIGET